MFWKQLMQRFTESNFLGFSAIHLGIALGGSITIAGHACVLALLTKNLYATLGFLLPVVISVCIVAYVMVEYAHGWAGVDTVRKLRNIFLVALVMSLMAPVMVLAFLVYTLILSNPAARNLVDHMQRSSSRPVPGLPAR